MALRCPKCRKEVVVLGVSLGAPDAEKIASGMREQVRKEGKLALFNPPPRGPYRCPACDGPLKGE